MDKIRDIFTVEEIAINARGEYVESWTSDYNTLEEAKSAARDIWYHLTRQEKKRRVIVVYRDTIYDDDGEEDRATWINGAYTALLELRE